MIDIRAGSRGSTVKLGGEVIHTPTPVDMLRLLRKRGVADQSVRLCADDAFCQWPSFDAAEKALVNSPREKLVGGARLREER
jgi:hypothetical protein